ncbi:MAG TPA: M1 family metallopeptidase [Paraburkholderia sp.]|nr:M1 family metallopeptidase [Paraburkholderia sp.]
MGPTPLASNPTIDKGASPVEMPDTVRPVNYKLWFRPNASLSSFDGRADVEIKVLKAVNAITIAGHRIKLTDGSALLQPGNIPLIITPQGTGDYYELRPVAGQIAAGDYTLHMAWSGVINLKSYDDAAKKTGGSCGNDPYPGCSAAEGIFRVDLKATDGTTSGAILTQGETDLARQWFPGWDEPAFRPTYEVSAEVPQNWKVVSNAAEKPAVNLADGYKQVSFEKTPPMPSYLLFFGGGQFDVLEDDFTSPLPDGKGLHLRIFTPPGMKAWAAPAMEQTRRALDYYYRYTGIPLPLTKFDTVAANDAFKAEKGMNFGGMENWGSILEFADDILVAPGESMSSYGKSVLTHEIAHQWFGDLVTLDWWDDVWLNESFARYFERKTEKVFFPKDFTAADDLDRKYDVIDADLSEHAFPVQPHFNASGSNDFVLAASTFTYSKGSYVLGMLENYLGEEVLRKGLQSYLADYQFGNGTPQRLWDELAKASGDPSIPEIGDSFVRQTGLPLLSLDSRCDAASNQTVVTLRQQPFPSQNPHPGTRWTIPVTLAYGDTLSARKTVAMKDTQMEVRLAGCSAVLANPGGLDYYVTNYSDAAWSGLLTRGSALKDRVLLGSLLYDAQRLTKAGLAPAPRLQEIAKLIVAMPVARRMATVEPTARAPRPALRYQGDFKPRKTAQ